MVEDMFCADEEHDNARVVRDHSPPLPTLPSAAYATKQIAATTTNTKTISNDIVTGWATLRTTRLAIARWIQPLSPIRGWAKKFHECYDIACQTDGDTQEEVD